MSVRRGDKGKQQGSEILVCVIILILTTTEVATFTSGVKKCKHDTKIFQISFIKKMLVIMVVKTTTNSTECTIQRRL